MGSVNLKTVLITKGNRINVLDARQVSGCRMASVDHQTAYNKKTSNVLDVRVGICQVLQENAKPSTVKSSIMLENAYNARVDTYLTHRQDYARLKIVSALRMM